MNRGKPLKRTPLKKISKKQSKRLAEYSKLKKSLNLKVCSRCGKKVEDYKLLDLHHLVPRGMGGDLLDKDNVVALCRECHRREHRR